jgi:hypothetical protein
MMSVATLIVLVLNLWTGIGQAGGSPTSLGAEPYAAAFYSPSAAGRHEASLQVFPFRTKAYSVPLPRVGRITYAPDGGALYAEVAPDPLTGSRLARIELDPVRVVPLPGSAGITNVDSIAVSKDLAKIVFSGRYPGGKPPGCGVFELAITAQTIRKILDNPECDYIHSWHGISLSPDGLQAVAVLKQQLAVIDLATGALRVLGTGYLEASWSPDGKWIAALENGGKFRTKLLDTADFTVRRVFGISDLAWSPDSRYLLNTRASGRCGESGTLEALDVTSGARRTIASSTCQANQSATGWVRLARRGVQRHSD